MFQKKEVERGTPQTNKLFHYQGRLALSYNTMYIGVWEMLTHHFYFISIVSPQYNIKARLMALSNRDLHGSHMENNNIKVSTCGGNQKPELLSWDPSRIPPFFRFNIVNTSWYTLQVGMVWVFYIDLIQKLRIGTF